MVSVWHIRVDDVLRDEGRRRRALEWLTPADRARHERYRFDADRNMFLVGRTMARALVGRALGVGPCDWEWREGPRGRPEIADPGAAAQVSFNLAHSAGLVACAVSRHGVVGVDVEHRQRPPVDERMVRRFCAPREVEDIERHGAQWQDQFLKYWTLKEAYLKARGVGLAVHLSDLSFTLDGGRIGLERLNSLASEDDQGWAFVLDASHPSHLVAAAVATASLLSFSIAPLPDDLLP
jgi:4'-phosphopantetheinyl transferase